MESVDPYVEMYRAAAQEATPQPVRAVGILGRAQRRTGFPNNVMMAVTPTRLMSFEFKGRQDRIKILRMVADWPRSVVDVEREPTANATVLRFRLIDGRNVEFSEPPQSDVADRVNGPFYEALGLPATA